MAVERRIATVVLGWRELVLSKLQHRMHAIPGSERFGPADLFSTIHSGSDFDHDSRGANKLSGPIGKHSRLQPSNRTRRDYRKRGRRGAIRRKSKSSGRSIVVLVRYGSYNGGKSSVVRGRVGVGLCFEVRGLRADQLEQHVSSRLSDRTQSVRFSGAILRSVFRTRAEISGQVHAN